MAINARWKHVCLFFPEFSFNNLSVHLFNLSVALSTRRGDVLPRYG
jgi:hypothetical protein